ncbi:MAG: Sulfide-quinone reductase [Methanonatronarchaeales archaeon]|nr:Sulfide-quinone reductase [Methanonatronarchaeales archaeon]
MEKIVVVGGGIGGTVVANRLANDIGSMIDDGEVEVTLVNDTPHNVYKPKYLYIPFGLSHTDETKRPLTEILNHRIGLEVDPAVDMDTDAKTLELESGKTLDYDYLVMATGAKLVPSETPGLVEAHEDDTAHWFYNPEGAEALRDALQDFEEGHLVLSVIGSPHICPVAPIEFPLIADAWFRERGIRDDIEITYTYPIQRSHGLLSVTRWMDPIFEDRGIDTEYPFNVEEVDPESQTLEAMEGELDFDLAVTIPPHAAGADDLIENAGIGDEGGWVDVDHNTLECTRADGVYSIGDNANHGTSKAGSPAHYQAGVVAKRLASQIRGEPPTEMYHGKTFCYIEAGLDEATYAHFNYDPETKEKQLPKESQLIHWGKTAFNETFSLITRGLI